MIVRMCGRCQEEIDKERKKASDAQEELEYFRKRLAEALGIDVALLKKEEPDKS